MAITVTTGVGLLELSSTNNGSASPAQYTPAVIVVDKFCLPTPCSPLYIVNRAQPTGWQNRHLPIFYGDIFLQYEEPGFSPTGIPPEIISARGEVKTSAIVRHGTT